MTQIQNKQSSKCKKCSGQAVYKMKLESQRKESISSSDLQFSIGILFKCQVFRLDVNWTVQVISFQAKFVSLCDTTLFSDMDDVI